MNINDNDNATMIQHSSVNDQMQQQEKQIKKKKCRGSRRKQRYRRQLYAKGLISEEVEKLIEEKFGALQPSKQQQQQQQNHI